MQCERRERIETRRQLRSAFAFGSAGGAIVVSVDGDVLFDMSFEVLGVVGVSEAAGGVMLLFVDGVVAAGVSVVAGGLDDCVWA